MNTKEVAIIIEVPTGIYCFRTTPLKIECVNYINIDGGDSGCTQGFDPNETDIEGVLKDNDCLRLKTIG